METIAYSRGKAISFLFAAAIALGATATARADEVVDLKGETLSMNAAGFGDYKEKIIENGTVTITESLGKATPGRYTIGKDAVVEYGANADFSGDWDLNIVNGGTLHQTATTGRLLMPNLYGDCRLTLDKGTFVTDDNGGTSGSSGAQAINFGMAWLKNSGVSGKDLSAKVVLKNDSTLSLPSGKLQIGGVRNASGNSYKANSLKVDFAVTNSTVSSPNKEIALGVASNSYTKDRLTDASSSYAKAVFGPGSDITCQQIFARPIPSPSAVFDGATIHWAGTGKSFIGQDSNVSGDIYEIQANGLTVDIPDGKSLTTDADSSALKGAGGITKIGEGSITWNTITVAGSGAHVFTGPLVVSNGTWTSSVGYAASAFKVDGANSVLALSGALTAANVALAATDGGTLTLAGATLADASPDLTLAGGGTTDYFTRDSVVGSYAFETLALGPGAVLDLDADASGADTISATTTNITATAANPVRININFTAAPSAGQTFAFFATDDAAKFAVKPKLGSLTVPNELSVVDGVLVMTVTADDYVWNGSRTNWGDEDAWTKGDAPATWTGGNNAIFNTPNAAVTLAADVAASKVAFNEDASITGSAVLTASEVSVVPDVSAFISAPTAGALTKTGAGTLTLGSSRTDQTTLSEGTLSVANGAALDPVKLTLGTDAAKPVTLDYGGQTLSGDPAGYLGAGMDVTLTNGTFAHTGDVELDDGNLPASLTIASDAAISTSGRYWINTEEVKAINVNGGEFDMSELSGSSKNVWLMQKSSGRLRINAADGAAIRANGRIFAATGQDSAGLSPKVDWVMVDSTLSITGNGLYLGNRGNQNAFRNHPVAPECRFSMTNGVLSAAEGIFLGNNPSENTSQPGGWYIAEFDDCIVTAKQCRVYGDRPASRIHFNGTTLVANGDGENWITATGFAEGATPVTIGADGLVLDANGKMMSVNARVGGSGGLTVKGGGRVTMMVSPVYTGVTKVEAGTTLIIPSLDGFTGGFETITASGALQEGVYPYIVIDGEGSFSDDLLKSLNAPEGCQFIRAANGKSILCVSGNPIPTWIGGVSGSLSVGANWSTGYVPNGGACVIGSAIDARLEKGDVFAPTSITFPADSASVTIAGDAITGIFAITNFSDATQTFTAPVVFKDKILVVQNAVDWSTREQSSVRFAGGVTGADFAEDSARYLNGAYTLTEAEDWIANTQGNNDRWGIPEGSSISLPFASDTSELALGEHSDVVGGAFTAAVVRTSARICCWNLGEYVVTEELAVTLPGADRHLAYRGSDGAFKFERLTLSDNGSAKRFFFANSGSYYYDKILFIGAGGIGFAENANADTRYICGRDNQANDKTFIRPWYSDFTIGTKPGTERDFCINRPTHIGTQDEKGIARTVTADAVLYSGTDPELYIEGNGRFVVNGVNMLDGPVEVKDTATLAINEGKVLTSGSVTVDSGATLEIASGVNTFGGLDLKKNSTVIFKFTNRAVAPQIAIADGKTLTANGAVTVKIPGDVRPTGGVKVLTTCGGFDGVSVTLADGAPDWVRDLSVNEDGNIVLDVKPKGTKIIVR